MDEIRSRVSTLDGSEVRVMAVVGEHFLNQTRDGWSIAKVINSSISLRFLGSDPHVFKPGMPFETHVSITYAHAQGHINFKKSFHNLSIPK